jgi:hypothetical protein
MAETSKLYVKPQPRWFHPGEEAELLTELEQMERNSLLIPVSSLRQLRLNPDGRIQEANLRFAQSAFLQACRLLSPGLGSLTVNLVDEEEQRELPRREDFAAAVQTFNLILEHRFRRLLPMRMLYNYHLKQIDGFLGPTHKPLNNSTLYNEATHAMGQSDPPTTFHSAALLGRRFSLRFRTVSPLFEMTIGAIRVPFYWAWCFSNGETTGYSVRATAGLCGPTGMSLLRGRRTPHSTQGFETRLRKLLGLALRLEPERVSLQESVARLVKTPLAFAEVEREPALLVKALIYSLTQRSVPRWLAIRVVDQAIYLGWDQKRISGLLPQVFAKRTAFDLYCHLVYEARRLDLDRRDKVERFAHTMLSPDFLWFRKLETSAILPPRKPVSPKETSS